MTAWGDSGELAFGCPPRPDEDCERRPPLLRAFLLYLSQATWARRIVMGWGFARRAAARFIAGDSLEEALAAIHGLNRNGLFVTLDHLGENVTDRQMAEGATQDYLELVGELDAAGVLGNTSLKLTQLGLNLSEEICLSNLRQIAQRANRCECFVRIDMEDSEVVDETLSLFHQLRDEGFTNLGLVIQSYLYRSERDITKALERGARIRLVKGAYDEPPDVAYPRKRDVDANFDRLARRIMDQAKSMGGKLGTADGKTPPVTAIATHDEARIQFAVDYAQSIGLEKQALEFQMLYGIRSDLQRELATRGYPVRVYVPYGTEWYPYFVRRLAERPANLWFFLSNLLRG
jgi:proline dehydrogenase